jgi:hypothetical protein
VVLINVWFLRSTALRFPTEICLALVLSLALTSLCTSASAQTAAYESAPISYSSATPHDPVAQLAEKLKSGKLKLEFSPDRGYLDAILRELHIPASSQSLVFSKTSFQRDRISPRHPRALYFNDDTYVGYVPGGEVIEIISTDANLGSVFYTLNQSAPSPTVSRQTDNCLQCHAGSMTRDTPGLLMRSVFTDTAGQPILSAGTFLTTDESPMKERWGGWYVTSLKANEPHMGNTLWEEQEGQDPKPRSARLSAHFDSKQYLRPDSDALALMVLAHQTEAHNRFTRAAYATRFALRDEKVINDAMGTTQPAGEHSESTMSRIKSGCDPLVEYLLFCGNAPLEPGLDSKSPFVQEFTARGPRDPKGRSLRDFDLHARVFRFPCSYLIDSEAFNALPEAAKSYTYQRIFDVLTSKETDKKFAHLSKDDRQAILEILRDTKSDLPAYWNRKTAAASPPSLALTRSQ